MIDFAKTSPLPDNVHITHRSPWSEGTHEDGYLLGLDNLIDLFSVTEKNLATKGNVSSKQATTTSSEPTNSSGGGGTFTATTPTSNSHSNVFSVSATPS